MVREAAAANTGRRPPPRADGDRAAARRRHGQRRHGPRPRRRRECPDEQARGRRRRPRLADRRAGRRQGEGHARTGASPTAATSKGRCPTTRPTARSGSLDPHWAAAFPHRQRPRLLRGDADQGAAARVQTRPDRGADLLPRRAAGRASDPRGPPGRTGPRQGRDAEPGALPDRPRPRPGRRRGACRRSPLRGRLRLGVPVGRMARRLRRPGAARRGVAGARPEALPPHPQTASSAATRS